VNLEEILNLAGFEALARARLPAEAYSYGAGGAGDEVTLRDNIAAFRRRRLRPRMLVDVSNVDPSTTMLGGASALPLGVAPMGRQGWFHPQAEGAGARAAAAAGSVFCASTLSNLPLEEIAKAGGLRWLQLYVHKDRSRAEELVKRAADAGYEAVVLTVDLPVLGYREREVSASSHFPIGTEIGNFPDMTFDSYDVSLPGTEHDNSLTWDFLARLRELSDLPLIIKGILTAEDAALAVEHGASGVVVSNHGGRQLDRAPATIDVLEEVVDAVAGRAEVYLDGGVRRGADVLIALALGASGVLIGRPFLWALAAAGEAGVTKAFELLTSEITTDMALLGTPRVADITRAHVQ